VLSVSFRRRFGELERLKIQCSQSVGFPLFGGLGIIDGKHYELERFIFLLPAIYSVIGTKRTSPL